MSSQVIRRIGHLIPSSSVLFICDIQTAFKDITYEGSAITRGTRTMISAAKLLDVPIVVTTQYASRLGPIVPEIATLLTSNENEEGLNVKEFDKTLFSMITPEVETHLIEVLGNTRKSIILCGIESHVCVLQTCLDLIAKGYDVHVVADSVSSSTSFNRTIGLERMRQSGAFITSVESSIFQLTHDSKHPKFRSISQLIKEYLATPNPF